MLDEDTAVVVHQLQIEWLSKSIWDLRFSEALASGNISLALERADECILSMPTLSLTKFEINATAFFNGFISDVVRLYEERLRLAQLRRHIETE